MMVDENLTNDKQTGQPDNLKLTLPNPRQTKRSKLAMRLTGVALIIIAVALLRILTWSFDATPILEVKNSPFPVRTIPGSSVSGGVIVLDVDYCKRKSVEGQVRVSFIGGSREVFLPLKPATAESGCHRREEPVLIPTEIIPGDYIIKFRVTYNVNPLRQDQVVEFESQPIHINPRE